MFPVPTWPHTVLLHYYWLYFLCCTLHPHDYCVATNLDFSVPSPCSPSPPAPSPLFICFSKANRTAPTRVQRKTTESHPKLTLSLHSSFYQTVFTTYCPFLTTLIQIAHQLLYIPLTYCIYNFCQLWSHLLISHLSLFTRTLAFWGQRLCFTHLLLSGARIISNTWLMLKKYLLTSVWRSRWVGASIEVVDKWCKGGVGKPLF